MSELPKGWAKTSLGEIAVWGSGGTPSRSEPSFYGGLIPWIKSGELNGRYVKSTEESITEAAVNGSSAKIFPAGSVAIAMYGATIGKTAILGVDAATNQACAVGIPIEGLIDTEFLYRLLQNEKDAFIEKGKGGAQPNISQAVIKAHGVNLPPLAEQTRIAAKLDELLAQVDTLKARIDGIPALLKRFRQSVLAAAVSGRLTEEWRIAHRLPEWVVSKFGDFGEVSGGLTKSAKRSGLTLKKPYLRVANVYANRLVLDSVELIGLSEAEFLKTKLDIGDILIVEGNGSLEHIGRAAIWGDEIKDCCHQNHLIRWRSKGGVQPMFALYQLLSPQGRKQLIDVAKSTTGLHTLSISKVSALELPQPHKLEQTEIVRRVEQLFAFADQLEARVKAAQTRIDRLTQSILAKAFRGELVPQDPNDEPASQLLERIKAQRAAAPKAKRKRRVGAD
ncbi:restriction endonuclease subunit S [Azotobacter salinestris]|uniref:restriction endonuclease subunit S n=1 Tax=Azotobacter salinestris TaxID=69964 RepID=UPI0032DF1284